MASDKVQRLLKTLGPGIMFAGTCIGGSHLVQSTKAGAFYGFSLLSIVLIANFFKYPFFEFASRYTNATGKSILDGYKKLHTGAVVVFALSTLVTMFIITGAIGALTGGLFNNLVNSFVKVDLWHGANWTLAIFAVTFGILLYGKFALIDKALKVIGVILVISVLVAFVSVVATQQAPTSEFTTFEILDSTAGFAFVIALMGWMPMGVDMSAWHSIWTVERIKQTGYYPTLKETLLDFNLGYGITVVLAVFFLTIGAYVLYQDPINTPEAIASMNGVQYAATLVDMFKNSVGEWSRYIIEIAAFATMFGTSITLVDGYCRSMVKMVQLVKGKESEGLNRKAFLIWVLVLIAGSYLVVLLLGASLGKLINFATITSFIVGPIAAYLNYRIIFSKDVPESHRPGKLLKYLAVAGIIFLTVFALVYIRSIIF